MINIREMVIEDYESVFGLLTFSQGIRLRDVDSPDAIERYLQRNPGLNFVAEDQGQLIGCVMCGHDGRRGYMQHLMVAPDYRRRGIGTDLVWKCLKGLEAIGILKTHIDVLVDNVDAIRFWTKRGWKRREDIFRFSFIQASGENV